MLLQNSNVAQRIHREITNSSDKTTTTITGPLTDLGLVPQFSV